MPSYSNTTSHPSTISRSTPHYLTLVALSLALEIIFASTATAQWTVTSLHPPGATGSVAYGASGGQQAGYARVGGQNHASLWSGTAASWVDLNPAGRSAAYAASDGLQAGYAQVGGVDRASLWSGTPASWIDLNPAGSTNSFVGAISGGQQAGGAQVGGVFRASLWSGTAASWVDLNPAGSTQSQANAISGGQQAGYALVDNVQRASLWNGTAASWIDLSPLGSTQSYIAGISGEQQAGFAYVGGVQRASLWTGTAASWVDLHPANATSSDANAVNDGRQAGWAVVGGVVRACLWSGTAASWVDLSAFLPVGFTNAESVALGISSDSRNLYISGYGSNLVTGQTEALLWTLPLCSPANVVIQPQTAATCPSGPAAFDVTAAGTGTLTYQWQYQSGTNNPDTFTWTNLVNGRNPAVGPFRLNAISAHTRLLVVDHDPTRWPDPVDHIPYTFRCIVTNTCGTATSDAASLILPLIPCPADFNGDCFVDFFDYLDFVDAFSAQLPSSDFNGDGGIDFFDYLDFVDAFSIGC